MSPRVLVAIAGLAALLLILGLIQVVEAPGEVEVDGHADDGETVGERAPELSGGAAGEPDRARAPREIDETPPDDTIAVDFGGGGNVGFNGLLREDIKARGGFEKSPPGTLGGLLLDGKEPYSGAEALLWTKGRGTGRRAVPAGREPLQATLITREGTFSFSHLDAGWYFVGVREPGGPARMAMDWLNPLTESKRAVIVLGTATVHGTVYHDGQPLGHESVRVEIKGERGVSTTLVETKADAAGRYEITRLLGGHASIWVGRGGDFTFPRRTLRLTLKPAMRTQVDLGAPR